MTLPIGMAAVVAATLGVAACSSGITATDTDPQLLTGGAPGSGGDALIIGELRYIEGAQCFVLENEIPATGDDEEPQIDRNVVVWPQGTQPVGGDGVSPGVEVPGYGAIIAGEWIKAGGDYVSPGESDTDLPDVSAECSSSPAAEFVVIDRIAESGSQQPAE